MSQSFYSDPALLSRRVTPSHHVEKNIAAIRHRRFDRLRSNCSIVEEAGTDGRVESIRNGDESGALELRG